ncbi:unnamed protein product [Rotaria sp. Silwood2]|nr:unnamed protein product [Rotaria sp. Silwood2]
MCPPSFYGDLCQYQNQRVSLTLQIQLTSDWSTLFTFSIILIDDEMNVESHDFIEYLSARDCDTKFNIYLLYSTRPKNATKAYSVRVDAFSTPALSYRASWIFPLRFSFLSVHRLSVLLRVPISDTESLEKCTPSCIHGKCFNYVNNQNSTFCQCEREWSGAQCDRKYTCDCSTSSLCINNSICVCPPDRFGPRCHLFKSSCHSEFCLNRGQCVHGDERRLLSRRNEPTCICRQENSGNRCEHSQTRIDISFHNTITIPQSLLIHFIRARNEEEHLQMDEDLINLAIVLFQSISPDFHDILLT